ncbi:MAG: hypothetical protein R3C99_19360 [Pirellulaceae bacterium]
MIVGQTSSIAYEPVIVQGRPSRRRLMFGVTRTAADGYRVVIDPGHGGTVDIGGSGANHATGVASGSHGEPLADLAKQLSGILTDNGFEAQLLRDADVNLS